MPCAYREYFLDSRANAFFAEEVNYQLEMDQTLYKHIDFSSGSVSTFLPGTALEEQDIYNFKGGAISDYTISRKCLAEVIQRHLSSAINTVCLLEDSTCEPGEHFDNDEHVVFLERKPEVYFLIKNEPPPIYKIESIINEAEQPNFFVGILSTASEKRAMPTEKIISSELLHHIARRVEKVILGVYDGEGYLIWNRHDVEIAKALVDNT